jgi:rsbT co-antagonist protein RsbR
MNKLAEFVSKNEEQVRADWMAHMSKSVRRSDLMGESELDDQTRGLLDAMIRAMKADDSLDLSRPEWTPVKDLMSSISASRARQGFTPEETATFVLSLKQPMFLMLRRELSKTPDELFNEIWKATELIDALAMQTTQAYISTREELILRQQHEVLELSTPVVKLWEGILALPIIGTLDSARTQVVMESLLQTVVATNSKFAIIDITGVPTVDTLVAQHLLKTITAARLMGAECIISGVRPQIAQTIVHLGINLEQVITKARLSDAFALALQRSGRKVVRAAADAGSHAVFAADGRKESS